MQVKITSFLILTGLLAFRIEARPQSINNYPFRPTFSELDSYSYYTTPMTYQQSLIQVWPYVVDQAVSPLYNLNQPGYGSNVNSGTAYSNTYNPYSNTGTLTGTGTVYNPSGYGNTGTGYNQNGYLSNSNIYSNLGYGGYTTVLPYLSNTNPFGIYSGKK